MQSAKLAQCGLAEFIGYLSMHGIAVVNLTEDEMQQDFKTLDAWLAAHP